MTGIASGAGFACNCIGPQNGQPRCPCMMRGVIEKEGRYVEPAKDLGPVQREFAKLIDGWFESAETTEQKITRLEKELADLRAK